MSKLRPIRDHIVFQFNDESIRLNGMTHFVDKTKWGFFTAHVKSGLNHPRVGTVHAVGPEAQDRVQPGDHILIDPLMWTLGAHHEFEEYWRTDLSHVIGVVPKEDQQAEPERAPTYVS